MEGYMDHGKAARIWEQISSSQLFRPQGGPDSTGGQVFKAAGRLGAVGHGGEEGSWTLPGPGAP